MNETRYIFEMAVFCGRLKVWRILNLNSGSVYSVDYETREEAERNIEQGEVRAGAIVRKTSIEEIRTMVQGFANLHDSLTKKS